MAALLTLFKALCWSATFAVMFGGAMRVGPPIFLQIARRPALFVRVLIAVWILVPLLTALAVVLFQVRGTSATLLLLMAVCPGIPVLLASTRAVRGSMKTALLALVLTATTEPLLIPYWTRLISLFLPVDLRVRPGQILSVLVPTVFVPIVLGFAVRAVWPRVVGLLVRVSDVVYLVGVTASAAVVLWKGTPLLPRVPPAAFGAAIVITLGDAVVGYWAGGPRTEDRKAVSLAAALGNPALALAVVEASFPGFQAAALVSVYLLVRALALVPVELWFKHRQDRQQRPA